MNDKALLDANTENKNTAANSEQAIVKPMYQYTHKELLEKLDTNRSDFATGATVTQNLFNVFWQNQISIYGTDVPDELKEKSLELTQHLQNYNSFNYGGKMLDENFRHGYSQENTVNRIRDIVNKNYGF